MRIEERFLIELNLRVKKWLLCIFYNPKYSQTSHHLSVIGKDLDVLTSKCGNIILMTDFNAEPADTTLSNFCEIYHPQDIFKDKKPSAKW